MTLLEVIIAMSLTSFLLMILMIFYLEASQMNKLNDKAAQQSFQERYVDNRLASVLSNLIPETDSKRPFYFMTTPDLEAAGIATGPALIFGYDNTMRWDRNFSGDVVGTLYVDRHHRLCLVTTPSLIHWKDESTLPLNKEVLMENVESIQFTFLEPPQDEIVRIKQPELESYSEWKKDYERVPAIIKLRVSLKGNLGDRNFAFVLPRKDNPILYTK